ncbi:PREDICTED: uncharacterized protein LOC105361900 [Ceratosolen solmsi marchali]|uniref:Uncharacterized protein LOC105361900 n=1 Tax=Ceratosolen solmsi marchali TaxID=326594 RepID=A0AAJ6YG87_9HYME|nr:PREDICTED: uncharacterized protein LOC105361900 [Ceratosolen solmsi marchali]
MFVLLLFILSLCTTHRSVLGEIVLTKSRCYAFCNMFPSNMLNLCVHTCNRLFRNGDRTITTLEDCEKYCDSFRYEYRSRCKYYCYQDMGYFDSTVQTKRPLKSKSKKRIADKS